jgi:hypothetical protein
MLYREVIDAWTLLDRPDASGAILEKEFESEFGPTGRPAVIRLGDEDHGTDVVRWDIPGANGKSTGGNARTLAIVGRLGGIGVRPRAEGMVSDADGAIVAVACALKLLRAAGLGEPAQGDVAIVTHICPRGAVRDSPVPGQMDSPAPHQKILEHEAVTEADALLSVDTTRSHYFLNHSGIAISPPVVAGYILKISDALMKICAEVTNEPPVALPITMQDITSHGNGIFRINSIMQAAALFKGPVVGVASVSRHPIKGVTTGANRPANLEEASRFCTEVARQFTRGSIDIYDQAEYARLVELYGSMEGLVRPFATES